MLIYKSEPKYYLKINFIGCFITLILLGCFSCFSKSITYDYFKDSTNGISKNELLYLKTNTKVGNCKSYGFDNATHWIRYHFQARNNEKLYWINHLSYYNAIQYYLYDITAKQWINSSFAGTEASAKNLQWDYLNSSFGFQTQKDHEYILLAGYRIFNGSIVINFNLINEQKFQENNVKSYTISMLLIGVALAIFIISLIFFFIKQLPIYVFYSAYVLGVIFLQLVNQGFVYYIIKSDTETYMLIYAFGSALFVISFLYFLVELLKTPLVPLFQERKIVNVMSLILISTFFIGAFLLNTIEYRQYLIQAQHIWFIGVMVFIVYMLAKGIVFKLPMRWYALLSVTPALISGLLLIVISFGQLDLWGYFKYNFNICLLVEVFILGFALVGFERRKIMHSSLIQQRVVILSDIIQNKKLSAQEKKKAYSSSLFSDEEVEKYLKKIDKLIIDTEIYLKQDLDQAEVAELVGLKPYMFSEIVNRGSNKNFNEFINHYRIAAAKRRLVEPMAKTYTIEGIGLACGFSSKSAFYTAFKKSEGITPSQFQKMES